MTTAPPLALIVLLLLLAGRHVGRLRGPAVVAPARPRRPGRCARALPRWLSSGTTAAVASGEPRTWRRDPQRLNSLVVPPAFAVMTCVAPAVFGSTAFLPFLGALTALMAAVTSANFYGQDGTALWLTLLIPGGEGADVRGRQLAWLPCSPP